MATQSLSILNTSIRQHGDLYSLNDLHKASGGLQHHRPKYWLANKQTSDLIVEIGKGGISPFQVYRGCHGGTYACRELVIAYAAWISAAFHLKVIRVFLDTQTPAPQPPADLLTAVADIKRARILVSFFQGQRTVSLISDDACCISVSRWPSFIKDCDDINRETLIDIIGACANRLSQLRLQEVKK